MSFMGEYNHTIDAKGRLIIPAKFREQLGYEFIVTKGMDGCLFGFPKNEWEIFEQQLRNLPLTQKSARQFVRYFTGSACTCELDKLGRILLPTSLREFANLDKDVVLSGSVRYIEIWNTEAWAENNVFDMDEIAAQMSELGFSI